MSIPNYSIFPVSKAAASASSSAFSFNDTRALSEQSLPLLHVQATPLADLSLPKIKPKRSISKEEWLDLQPPIERLYLRENRPFPYIAGVLREEYGFEPTKHQFSRKVQEWGFRKYVSQSERRQIRQILESEVSKPSPALQDRRIGPGKLRNWRRKYGQEVNVARVLRTQRVRAVTPVNQVLGASIGREEDISSVSGMQHASEALPMIEQFNEPFRMEDLGKFALQAGNTDHDTWLSTHTAVDVPGFPRSKLLSSAIEIKLPDPVLPISFVIQNPEDSQCISGTEILDLCNGGNRSSVYEIDTSCSSKLLRPLYASLKGQTRSLPGSDRKFPFCRWTESPQNEIYAYPVSHTMAVRQPPGSEKPLWERLETQAAELRLKISKMESSFDAENPGIITMKESLAAIYLRQGSYQKAEELCRFIGKAKRKRFGRSSLETIAAEQNLARALQYQGRYLRAQDLLSKIYSRALNLASPTHIIVTETILLMAEIALDLDDDEKAEGQLRQVLQILWETQGPWNYRTRMCMGELGYALGKSGKYFEAEKLLQTALQLDCKFAAAGEEEDLCDTMRDLSLTLSSAGQYKESENVARRAVERFKESLGLAHPAILKARLRVARSLVDQEQYKESEEICRDILGQQSNILGESHPDTLSTVWLLAISLEGLDLLEEATLWYERSFQGDLRVYGPDGKSTISSCKWLGKCYEDQRRYDDATKLYQELMEKINAAKGDEHPAIAEIRGWIEGSKVLSLGRKDDISREEASTIGE